MSADTRSDELRAWIATDLGRAFETFEPASEDASFRRYFRVANGSGTWIAMDAPPDREDIRPWLRVARLLAEVGVHVPAVYESDPTRGFVLLEDLGGTPFLAQLGARRNVEPLYADALAALARIQVHGREAARQLPPYDRAALVREMELMPEWFCARHLKLHLSDTELGLIVQTFDFLAAEIATQPRVFVHRDYHSRNLMIVPQRNPGIIDFQDALEGPIGYDLVSLLKDCYVSWPRARVLAWLREYRQRIRREGLDAAASEREFVRWFDLAGVQRHLKVLGIFARLWYRDGKRGFLADLPLTLDYVRDTTARYAELQSFARWLEQRVVPHLAPANARERVQR
jgi:hypothetical protein